MVIKQRPYKGEADKRAMEALVYAFPNSNLHVTDLPYRLSSWALDVPENIRLWFHGEDRLVAWAALQSPFWTIDYAYSPNAGQDLHREILNWTDHRARQILDSAYGHPAWFVNVFAEQADRIRDLEDKGFASQANAGEDSWSKVFMFRPADTPVSDCPAPPGFRIRPLGGEKEVEAYVKLHQTVFESKNMTVEWRSRTLRHPSYGADLDLVGIAPDGKMAAFCVGWLNTQTEVIRGQIEPLGVHEDYRKSGLGRAILSEGIQRLIQNGASSLYVETDNYRNEAFRLYESAGFRVIKEVLVFRKDYNGS